MRKIAFSFITTVIFLCSCGSDTTKSEITAEMAYEGVSNYCHSAYDWSVAKDNPSIMYVQMGEETDSAYDLFVEFLIAEIILPRRHAIPPFVQPRRVPCRRALCKISQNANGSLGKPFQRQTKCRDRDVALLFQQDVRHRNLRKTVCPQSGSL